ncbi:uncharacterized protein EI90DRAFT_3029529 [Cantharellus anzutake]|uniref:uncharacterized protein n=1 Tax=Cantharellus anzutake TaxID=1750568 RepID=UPI00190802F2|nr:uncharacterized protein EI90DRAFT_3029529 [Cantharellus anzutake]KAF8342591.1 hypothetical protein EI90DRAFT_3029529 [Cantharellus anzutake]
MGPIEQLKPGEKRRQKGLIKLCIELSPEIMDKLIRSYGPYPLFWRFNVRAMIQELEAGSKAVWRGRDRRFMVTRERHPMGLHSREAVRDAIEKHHQPLGCSTGSPTTSAAPFQSYPPTCSMPCFPPLTPISGGQILPFPIPLPPPPIPLPPPLPLPQFPFLRQLPPTNRHLQMSRMLEYTPCTRQISDEVHVPTVRGRQPNPFGTIGSHLPTRGNL